MEQNSHSIVILANGSYPTHSIPLDFLSKNNTILCCDGSIDRLLESSIKPKFILGDLDSISKKSLKRYSDIIIEESNQNYNDLYKCLTWCKKNKYSDITILGASGNREDHTIGNIFLLFEFSNDLSIKMITDDGVFTLINANATFKSYKNQPVSIFCIDKSIRLITKNLKYPINNNSLVNLFSGTLNQSNSNKFNIDISHGSILVFQKHKN